jgi:hypothetical protein
MDAKKIYDENGQGYTRIFSTDKVESVNPVDYYKNYELEKRATVLRDLLNSKDPVLTSQLDKSFFLKQAEDTLEGFFEKFEKTEPHENFIKLLETTRKKDQVRLLKGLSINPDELMSLILKSHKDFGFLYSKYRFENLPSGFEGKKLPELIQLNDDGSIKKIGDTDLTNGELKNAIEHRKVIIAHFFEKDEVWHCFFTTYNSIGGKENWKNGQAHYHYISSAFGISKADFIESMRTGKYKSTSIHIDLKDYGNQSELEDK